MALMRYVGPYDEVKVIVAGYEIGNVERDGSIVVPDELASQVHWPEDLWEDASDPEAEKEVMAEHEKALAEVGSQPSDMSFVNDAPGEDAN